MLARIDRLPPDARDRVLAIEGVDGAPVVVTRMILDFDSFGKWLDRVLPASQASQAPPAPAPSSGGFTDIFVSTPVQQKGTPIAAIDSPTVSWTPPKVAPKPAAPKPTEAKPPEPKQPSISVRFREPGSGPKPPAAPPPPPPKPAAPPPPPPKAPAPGEFTRIFGATHVEPDPPAPPPAAAPQFMPPPISGASPSATSALERVVAPPPRTSAPTSPPLSPSSPWSGPPPVVPLPPSSSASATPMPGANINLPPSAPVMPAQPVQSDFTRIIGAAHATPSVAPPPTPPAPLPAAAPQKPSAAGAVSKKVVPILVAFGTLVLAALVLVIVALIRRH
ncbi:MAG TPA: hypothetical protein VFA43_25690 [Gemmatimonadaceae bacterium]|nr:hypothetical protein [Gemmatimonadaceae bacterium]